MRVVSFLLLLGVAAVVAKNSTSSTGPDAASTGVTASTGAAPIASSTGAAPIASSTGAAPVGASSSTGMAPVTGCSAQDSCGSCFSSGCVWCVADKACVDAANATTCTGLSPRLPAPLNFIDLTNIGSEACDFIDCIPALNAHSGELNTMEKDLLGGNPTLPRGNLGLGSDCVLDFYKCKLSNATYCNLDCDFTGVDLDTYKDNCTKLAGSVYGYSYDDDIVLNNSKKETVWTDVPFCVPDTCLSQSNWTKVFADAHAAALADSKICRGVGECTVKSVELLKGSDPGSGSDSGVAPGVVVAIVLGSLVGVALLFFIGQKMCKSQTSEYQPF